MATKKISLNGKYNSVVQKYHGEFALPNPERRVVS